MKKILIATILFFSTTALANNNIIDESPDIQWFKDSFGDIKEDVEEAKNSNKRLMLYFYQHSCPYCRLFQNETLSDTDASHKIRKLFDVVKINMWGDKEISDMQGIETTEKEFSLELGVQYTPTLLLFNEEGKVVMRINGYYPKKKILKAVDHIGNKKEKTLSFRKFYNMEMESNTTPENKSQDINLKNIFDPKHNDNFYKPLMVIFENNNCDYCNTLHEDILKREAVSLALSNFNLLIIDTNSKDKIINFNGSTLQIDEWISKLKIETEPTIVFFDSYGKEIIRAASELQTYHFHSLMDYVSTKAYKSIPNYQRFLQHRRKNLRGRGHIIEMMK